MRKRREVLDARLNIDEPHLCSQYKIACTCWSFCTGAEGKSKSSPGAGALPAAQTPERARKLPPQAQSLPVVHRSGMESCPFRFVQLCRGGGD